MKSHCLFSMFFVGSSSFSQLLNGLPRSQTMFFCFLYYLYSIPQCSYPVSWLIQYKHVDDSCIILHSAQISLLDSRFIYLLPIYIYVFSWKSNRYLRLNMSQTNQLSPLLSLPSFFHISLTGNSIFSVAQANNLSAIFDSSFLLQPKQNPTEDLPGSTFRTQL